MSKSRQFEQTLEYYTIELFVRGIGEAEETLDGTYDTLAKAEAAFAKLTPPDANEYFIDLDPYERWQLGYRICRNVVHVTQVGWAKYGVARSAKSGRRPLERAS